MNYRDRDDWRQLAGRARELPRALADRARDVNWREFTGRARELAERAREIDWRNAADRAREFPRELSERAREAEWREWAGRARQLPRELADRSRSMRERFRPDTHDDDMYRRDLSTADYGDDYRFTRDQLPRYEHSVAQRQRYGAGDYHPTGGRDRVDRDREVDYLDRQYRGYQSADRNRRPHEYQSEYGSYGRDRAGYDDRDASPQRDRHDASSGYGQSPQSRYAGDSDPWREDRDDYYVDEPSGYDRDFGGRYDTNDDDRYSTRDRYRDAEFRSGGRGPGRGGR